MYGEPIETFVSQLDLDSFRFDRLVASFGRYFPEVSVASYESIEQAGPEEFLRRFFEWAGAGAELLDHRARVENQSINDVQLDVCRTLWRHGSLIAPRAAFMSWVRRMPALPGAPSSKTKLSPEMRASLDARFADDLSYRARD
jgi:hypothetical protein